MKYSGCITILDDKGETVFERELSADEMIDCLVHKDDGKFLVVKPSSAGFVLPEGHQIALGKVHKNGQVKSKKQRICSLCSKPGHRSDNCLTRNRPPKGFVPASVKDSKEPLTQKEYNEVQQGKKDDLTSAQIAGEMNVNIQEVNWAFMHSTYDHYLSYRAK